MQNTHCSFGSFYYCILYLYSICSWSTLFWAMKMTLQNVQISSGTSSCRTRSYVRYVTRQVIVYARLNVIERAVADASLVLLLRRTNTSFCSASIAILCFKTERRPLQYMSSISPVFLHFIYLRAILSAQLINAAYYRDASLICSLFRVRWVP